MLCEIVMRRKGRREKVREQNACAGAGRKGLGDKSKGTGGRG